MLAILHSKHITFHSVGSRVKVGCFYGKHVQKRCLGLGIQYVIVIYRGDSA